MKQNGGRNLPPAGPRKPYWGCSCGFADNFACREACWTCGKKRLLISSAPGHNKAGQHERSLKQELAAAKRRADLAEKKLAEGKSAQDDDMEVGVPADVSIEDLLKSRKALVAVLGQGAPEAASLQVRIDEARKRKLEAKPPLTRLQDLERKKASKEKAHKAAAARESKAREVLQQASAETAQAARELEEAAAELEENVARFARPTVVQDDEVEAISIPREVWDRGAAVSQEKVSRACPLHGLCPRFSCGVWCFSRHLHFLCWCYQNDLFGIPP